MDRQEKYLKYVMDDLFKETKIEMEDLYGTMELCICLPFLTSIVMKGKDAGSDFFVPLCKEETNVGVDSVYAIGLMEHYSITEEEFRKVWGKYEFRIYRRHPPKKNGLLY